MMLFKLGNENSKYVYPDMKLFEEIILLKHFFKGKWVVENVIGYYKPFYNPAKLQRHYFWSNFVIPKKRFPDDKIFEGTVADFQKHHNIYLDNFDLKNQFKEKLLRNCVNPHLGLYAFKCGFKDKQKTL